MELVWKSEDEMWKELDTECITRDREKYGNDGVMKVATGTFEYKRVKYVVNVMRYYVLDIRKVTGNIPTIRPAEFRPMGFRSSEYFANLEYSDETKLIRDIVKQIRDDSEFLWFDSLHSYCDKMTTEEQIEEMHRKARADIDSLETLNNEIDIKIRELEVVKQQVRDALLLL